MNNNTKKYVYVWKRPTEKHGVLYIIGDENVLGGRDHVYENGCKASENEVLHSLTKLASIQITVDDIDRDHGVHKIIHNDFKNIIIWDGEADEGILHTREAFYFKDQTDNEKNDQTICEIVSKICTKDPDDWRRVNSWLLRDYQDDKVKECVKKLTMYDKVLLHLAMRGGKSVIALEIARIFALNYAIECASDVHARILVITPFPSAEGTFRNYTLCHRRMKGFKYYGNGKDNMPDSSVKQFVKFASFQTNYDDDFIKKLGQIDLVIVDETHHTSASFRSMMKVLSKINHTKELHLSGTPFNDILSQRFTKDQTVSLDIIDLMKISQSHPEMKIYPETLNVKDVCNMEELRAQLKIFGKDDPNFMKWLEDNQMFRLKDIFENRYACMTFLKYISIDHRNIQTSEFYLDPSISKRILMCIPTVKGVATTYACIKELAKNPESVFFGYAIMPWSPADDADDDDASDHIPAAKLEDDSNKFMSENNKTIMLSCNRGFTGVTLHRLDTILNFKKIASAETFFQLMFRIMTYCDGKNEVNMFNYDSEYVVKIFKELAAVRQENVNHLTEKDALGEIFSCINYYKVLASSPFEFERVDAIKGYELFRKMPLTSRPNDVLHYTINDFTENEYDTLMNSGLSTGTKSAKTNVTVHSGKGGNSKPKTKSNEISDLLADEKVNIEKNSGTDIDNFLEALNAILVELTWIIYLNDIKTVDELSLASNTPTCVASASLSSIYKRMISIRRCQLQQLIDDIQYKKSHDSNDELIKQLPALSISDKLTPTDLIDEMISNIF